MTQPVRRLPQRPRSPSVNAQPLKLWQDVTNAPEVRIEIVPLIDVIFCILTFFILAAVGFSRQQAISLDLPQAATGAAQMRELIVISLDDFGQVYVEQQPVSTRAQLAQAVENYFLARPEGRVVLRASRNATYNEVVQVLDLLREAGGDRVALATFPRGSAAESAAEAAPAPGLGLPDSFDPFNSGLDSLPGAEGLPGTNGLPGTDGLPSEGLPGATDELAPNLPARPQEDGRDARSPALPGSGLAGEGDLGAEEELPESDRQ